LTFVTLSAAVQIVFNNRRKLAEVYFIHNITMANDQQWTLPPRAFVFADRFYFRHCAAIKDDEMPQTNIHFVMICL